MPLGLLAAVAGFIWLLGAEGLNGDYQNVYPTAGIMLTTVLYGGVASAIGYFKLLSASLQEELFSLSKKLGLWPCFCSSWFILCSRDFIVYLELYRFLGSDRVHYFCNCH